MIAIVVESQARIFLLDDHPLVRTWLMQLIEQQPDLSVCGEAGTSAKVAGQIAAAAPDMAIIDLALPDGSGLDLIRQLKKSMPQLKMLVFSMHDERLYAERALRAGAAGYVMKRATAEELIDSIYRVLRGKIAVSRAVDRLLDAKFGKGIRPPEGPCIERLSDRELEIFQLLGSGEDTKAVAKRLKVSIKTVQAHCANIKVKLDLENATELLREAIRWTEFNQL